MERVLKVVGGNPLATRENSDRSSPDLSLVCQQEGTLARKKPQGNSSNREVAPLKELPQPWYGRGWKWLNNHGPAIQSIAIIGGMVWVIATMYFRLDRIESELTSIASGVPAMNERLIRIEESQKSFDKYILPQILPRILPQVLSSFKPKATEILGASDVGIFTVVHNEVKPDTPFSVPYKGSLQSSSPQKQGLLSYNFGIEKDGSFVIQAQLQEIEGMKIVRTLATGNVKGRFPSEVGRTDEYCSGFASDEDKFSTPAVCFEVVLLGRIGSDNPIFASAVRLKDPSYIRKSP
jgi:hypothetical protein